MQIQLVRHYFGENFLSWDARDELDLGAYWVEDTPDVHALWVKIPFPTFNRVARFNLRSTPGHESYQAIDFEPLTIRGPLQVSKLWSGTIENGIMTVTSATPSA